MSTVATCRCLGCGQTDERRSTGVEWALKDTFARTGVCTRCFASDQQPKLRERFVREGEKARATMAMR